jgi:hypothetical protein
MKFPVEGGETSGIESQRESRPGVRKIIFEIGLFGILADIRQPFQEGVWKHLYFSGNDTFLLNSASNSTLHST